MASPETVVQLIDYYCQLLIIQYHEQPKAQATIAAYIKALLANAVALDVQNGYNVDTAIGVQLDVLGKYADINRFYQGQDFSGFFSFITYDEVSSPPGDLIGFSTYAEFPNKPGAWLTYPEILSTTLALTDDQFRFLLKLRIIQNNSNFSHQSIDQSMFNAFGLTVVPDSTGNMVMDYFADNANFPLLLVAIQKGVLPKPMGVAFRYLIKQAKPFFGFATYNSTPALTLGFTDYANYDIDSGETLTYADLLEV